MQISRLFPYPQNNLHIYYVTNFQKIGANLENWAIFVHKIRYIEL